MTGFTTIDFGAASSWNNDVQAIVTGQSLITSASTVEVYLQGDSTSDNDSDAHVIASSLVTMTAENITTGGFTIRAMSDGDVTGTFKVRWAAI